MTAIAKLNSSIEQNQRTSAIQKQQPPSSSTINDVGLVERLHDSESKNHRLREERDHLAELIYTYFNSDGRKKPNTASQLNWAHEFEHRVVRNVYLDAGLRRKRRIEAANRASGEHAKKQQLKAQRKLARQVKATPKAVAVQGDPTLSQSTLNNATTSAVLVDDDKETDDDDAESDFQPLKRRRGVGRPKGVTNDVMVERRRKERLDAQAAGYGRGIRSPKKRDIVGSPSASI